MSVLIRSIVAIPLLALLAIVSWMLGAVVDPLAAEILAVPAVERTFGPAAAKSIRAGVRYVLPGLGLIVAGWWVFGEIARDERRGVRGGRRR